MIRTQLRLVASIVAVCVASVVHAQGTTKCNDGTTSTASGRGACSGHGGVAAKATKEERKSEKKAEKAEKKAEKKADKEVAMVTCTDGTQSKGGRGACSRHG